MTIGFRIPGAAGKKPLAELAQWAADNGFGAIDIGRPDEQAVEAVGKAGLEVGTFDLGGTGQLLSPDAEARQAAAQRIGEQAKRAQDQGLTRAFGVLLPPNGGQSRGQSFLNWREGWPAASEALAGAGVAFCLEGWPGGGPNYPALGVTPETVRAMLAVDAEKGAGALKLNYDPSHLARIGVDPLRFLSEFGAHVRHAHGKDTAFDASRLYETGNLGASLPGDVPGSAAKNQPGFGEGWWRYCIPGDGVVNWAQVAAGLSQYGFDGVISVELEDARYNGSWEGEQQGLRRSRAHLGQFWG
ncbi:MAG: sugar phosphate isomerase/epimerase [Armatimonadetes bacterium]|nr:sugar phosphate isomerase/epimerase [Armatimonadota bacterium]